jgi:hypothetical protein
MVFFDRTIIDYGWTFLESDLLLSFLTFEGYLRYFRFHQFLYINHYLVPFALDETVYFDPK